MKRGEVWLVNLEPVRGHEIRKTRPCIVVSPDQMNVRLGTATIVPMTTGSWPAPFRIAARFQGKDGLILLDQLRTVDRSRLVKKLGVLGDAETAQTLATLRDMFEL